jgi:hypothetical protein
MKFFTTNANTITRIVTNMTQEEKTKLQAEIKDLLNAVAIKLENVPLPEVDEEYEYWDETDSGAAIPVNFKDHNRLSSIKVIVGALLHDLEQDREWHSPSEKMARAYYSSFCNG